MRVLVGCECSQVVTAAFLAVGCDAWSCDIQPSYGQYPERHIQGDLREVYQRIKEYILEMFSGSCCHVPECFDSFIHDDDFAFCGECSVKDFLLSCSRSAILIEENSAQSDSAIH